MSDPNGKEAGIKFLEENKAKEGVITLASGLQYKVLEEGAGMDHPKVDSPCECHYAGRLLDGTEFDSSYKRGQPTTFAPNQVIKGWTEAMQMMVVGDKWEMYIPMELAYGPNGKPPKIPAAATLIFIMEIVKIKGSTVPRDMTNFKFPEWTPEELALFTEKDEEAITKWRVAKIKAWDEGGKVKEDYPDRADFDAWLEKQSLSAKNKSLWKRTRAKKPAGPPKLTKETARELLTKALTTFKLPENTKMLTGLIKECEDAAKENPESAGMMKMMKLMPAVQGMMGETLKEYGFGPDDSMNVIMQVQAFAPEDPSIAADVAKLMKAVQGDIAGVLE